MGWEFLQRMSGKWGPVRKHRGGTVGSGLFAEKAASTQPIGFKELYQVLLWERYLIQ